VFGLFDNNVLRIGGLYNHWVAPEGKRFWVGSPMDDHTFSLVAVDEHVVGDLSANIGIRANFTYLNEYGQFSMEGTTKGFGNVQPITDEWQEPQLNGNIGASYDASENLSIHANGATGIIQPRKGAFSDTDAELKNELRSKIDLGLKTSLPRLLSADFVLFGVVRKNGLGLSPDTYEDPSTNLVFEKYNNRDYYQMGVELDLHSARLFDIIELFGNATYIRSLVDKDGDYEQNKEVPSVILGAGAMAEWLGFDANVFTKYVGPYENDRFGAPGPGKAPKWYPLGDYANIDITLGYAPRFLGRHKPRIYMAIENVTDNEYLTVIGYPDYGRRYAAGIQYGL
jgi:outer membrane cobalamin receptor